MSISGDDKNWIDLQLPQTFIFAFTAVNVVLSLATQIKAWQIHFIVIMIMFSLYRLLTNMQTSSSEIFHVNQSDEMKSMSYIFG